MKQLREQIRKEIKTLMESRYPAPPEVLNALKVDLGLTPLIRYVKQLKAANTIPPSYRVSLINDTFFDIYFKEFSLMVKVGPKEYFIGDGDERNYAIKHINRLLTQPIFTTGEEETEPTGDTGEGGDTSDAGEETADSDVTMEPEDEIPEDEQTT
tara:strand:+ start:207 stop:671 length:465 start_codon:yes stop_codon:yes gene_type:complete